ncbi:MAG: hypothetical protein GYA14_15870 [Ignavibacteria bacterium]|nr:hypothetical protein [Ignavibacteria bacterium]
MNGRQKINTMKLSEKYLNLYPLEPLLPEIDESEVQKTVQDCDYTYEADKICEHDKIDNKVNIADATVFYMMGYEHARELIDRKLRPL